MGIDTTLFMAFVAVSFGLIIVPGPNVLLVISTSLASGPRRGLQTVCGTSSAMAIQLTVATLGMTTIMIALSSWLEWVRWAGVAYLLYLGVQQWRASFNDSETEPVPALTSQRAYWRGFFVSMTNPKTVLFFGAFLPQFVNPEMPVLFQMTVLSVTFLTLATILDSMYALLSGRLHGMTKHRKYEKLQQRATGSLFLGAGAGLALTR